MRPVGQAADRVKNSISWLWRGVSGDNNNDKGSSSDEEGSKSSDFLYQSKNVDFPMIERGETWIIDDGSTCGQLNPLWSDVPGASEALIDADLFEKEIRAALDTHGVWPSYGDVLVQTIKTNEGLWAPINKADYDRITLLIKDSQIEDLVPKSVSLKAPANAIPRWAVKLLRPHIKIEPPCLLQRQQIVALHEEWFPISYDDNYFDGIAPGCTYIEEMELFSSSADRILTSNSSNERNKLRQRRLYDYRHLITIASVIPSGSYDIRFPAESSDLSEISRDKASERLPWQPNQSTIPPGSLFYGCRKLKKIIMTDDMIVGLINIRKGYVDYTECDYDACLSTFSYYNENLMPDNWLEQTGYIMSFGVSDAWMNLGIGKGLMDQAAILCKQEGIKLLTLHVITHNYGGKRFYEREYFQKINEQPGYYEFNGIIWTADTYCLWVPAYLENEKLTDRRVNHEIHTLDTVKKAIMRKARWRKLLKKY